MEMQKEEIYKILNTIFQDVFDDSSIEVKAETTADDIEDWDSMEQINLIVLIEKKFGIKFQMEEVSDFHTVGEMVDVIIQKLEK